MRLDLGRVAQGTFVTGAGRSQGRIVWDKECFEVVSRASWGRGVGRVLGEARGVAGGEG